MPEMLPQGWIKTTLGQIAEPSRERASPLEEPEARYVGLEHIEPHSMRFRGDINARQARSSSVRFSKGDVLYGKMRPYLNKVWVAEFDGLCSAEFIVFQKRAEVNSHFLAMRLNAGDFVAFSNGQTSGERPRVDFEKLSHFRMLLPPLAEQERIVAKLRATFSGVARAEAAASRAQGKLQRYRAAVLDAAVTGQLTRVWRESRIRGETTATGEGLLHDLLVARRSLWEETERKRFSQTRKEPLDDKWKSRYPEPRIPTPTEISILPSLWAWASLEQVSTSEVFDLKPTSEA